MHYKEVCTATEQYKVVLHYSIVRTNIAMSQLYVTHCSTHVRDTGSVYAL